METKYINLTVKVTTNKTLDEIEAGITKGVYYGLDVKGVAAPKNVEIKY